MSAESLIMAIRAGDAKAVTMLLDAGADPDSGDERGRCAPRLTPSTWRSVLRAIDAADENSPSHWLLYEVDHHRHPGS